VIARFITSSPLEGDVPVTIIVFPGFLGSICGVEPGDPAALQKVAATEGDDMADEGVGFWKRPREGVNLYRSSTDAGGDIESWVAFYRLSSSFWEGWKLEKTKNGSGLFLGDWGCPIHVEEKEKVSARCFTPIERESRRLAAIENTLTSHGFVSELGVSPKTSDALRLMWEGGLSSYTLGQIGMRREDIRAQAAFGQVVGNVAEKFPTPSGLSARQEQSVSQARMSLGKAGRECAVAFGTLGRSTGISGILAFQNHYERCEELIAEAQKYREQIGSR